MRRLVARTGVDQWQLGRVGEIIRSAFWFDSGGEGRMSGCQVCD